MGGSVQKNGLMSNWGRNGIKVLNPYLASIKQDCDIFKSKFDDMIKKYIHD